MSKRYVDMLYKAVYLQLWCDIIIKNHKFQLVIYTVTN